LPHLRNKIEPDKFDLDDRYTPAAKMKFCPTCRNYLYLDVQETKDGETTRATLRRICHNCGYQEADVGGGLVLETNLKETTSEGYHALVNEFTKLDPTLPHVDTLKCPKADCASNAGSAAKDVIYIKYDPVGLKFLYICNVCDARWKSKA